MPESRLAIVMTHTDRNQDILAQNKASFERHNPNATVILAASSPQYAEEIKPINSVKIESNGNRESRCESHDKWRDKPRPSVESERSSRYSDIALSDPLLMLPLLAMSARMRMRREK